MDDILKGVEIYRRMDLWNYRNLWLRRILLLPIKQ
jgi:hypothetical protein